MTCETADGGAPNHDDGLRGQARAIWESAIQAVDPAVLVTDRLAVEPGGGAILARVPSGGRDGRSMVAVRLDDIGRIVVVGGGKAAAGLAAGFEAVLGSERLARHAVSGLVSVPEGSGARLERIEVRQTRPRGVNLPTAAVVEATGRMLAALGELGPNDLGVVLLSGGGSALVESPRPGVTLDDLIARTTVLSQNGATIAELNAARSRMSRVKGGGLAEAAGAGRLLVLVLSDVVGDDLRVVASGPCMPPDGSDSPEWTTGRGCHVSHCLLGGNGTAVAAAAQAARKAGYEVRVREADPRRDFETAAEAGRRLAAEGITLSADARGRGLPMAIIEGGEAVVRLPTGHGAGGRNQQTVIAAAQDILHGNGGWPHGLLIASIGTDGEDGPTDAAGGIFDAAVARRLGAGAMTDAAGRVPPSLVAAVAAHDAYPLLRASGGLVMTGPTGTNVADVRIVLARP